MDFGFAKDQDLLRKSAKEFFEKECPKERVRELKEDEKGYDPKTWKKMVDLGFVGLAIPEEFGGTEGQYLDLMIFMEEMGRNIVPCPYFTTVALCSLLLLEFATKKQKEQHLPAIAEKGQIWSLAINEEASDWEASDVRMSAVAKGDSYVLNGVKLFVPYANVAEKLLVVVRTGDGAASQEGITVFIVDAKAPGITCEVIPTTARDMRCELAFKNVSVAKENVLGTVGKGWDVVDHIIQRATVLKCAEMSGGAQGALDITVKYARERIQFDKPIGSFQAVQHRLVELLTEVEGLKYIVYEAAWNIDEGHPSRMLNSIAKAKANHVYHRVCFNGIFTHGAIGWTEEMDIGLYHIRTKSYDFDCGGADYHRERIAVELENLQPAFLTLWS
ncbi:acyl-CoA dehydrogenase family protein [Thermodesulfobacteriota bacterium]